MATLIFSILFGRLARMPSDGVPYPVFAYVAMVPWQSLRERADRVVEQPRGQPERDKEGVLPATHHTPRVRHRRSGRFLLRIYCAHRNDVSLWNRRGAGAG